MKHGNIEAILIFIATGVTLITSFLMSMFILGKVIDKFFGEQKEKSTLNFSIQCAFCMN